MNPSEVPGRACGMRWFSKHSWQHVNAQGCHVFRQETVNLKRADEGAGQQGECRHGCSNFVYVRGGIWPYDSDWAALQRGAGFVDGDDRFLFKC